MFLKRVFRTKCISIHIENIYMQIFYYYHMINMKTGKNNRKPPKQISTSHITYHHISFIKSIRQVSLKYRINLITIRPCLAQEIYICLNEGPHMHLSHVNVCIFHYTITLSRKKHIQYFLVKSFITVILISMSMFLFNPVYRLICLHNISPTWLEFLF